MPEFGKVRFYADENIEDYLVDYIRNKGYKVEYAIELGFSGRDDTFHFQEAKKRKCVLLTRDRDYMNHTRFPFRDLNNTAIVILRSENRGSKDLNFGYLLVNLLEEVAVSGNQNIYGLKIEIMGPRMIYHARYKGKIRTDEVDISKAIKERDLFASGR